jgi:4-amino-4-deoxy-L-arabinose transferase-like glycosyltransferase
MRNSILWSALVILVLIFALGLYLRYESVLETVVIKPLRADAANYFMYAYNLRLKHTYSAEIKDLTDPKSPVTPDAIRPPGYPLFLTCFVNGPPNKEMIDKVLIFQAVMSAFTIIVAFLIFKSFLPVPWNLLASLLVALSPHLIAANSYVLTETLFCFLLVVFGLLITLFWKKPSSCLGIIVGIVIGLASLVRVSLQYFWVIVVFLFIFHFGWRKGSRFSVLIFLGFAISFSPWIARNLVTLKKPTDNRLMINFLHHGMYPNFTFQNVTESYGHPYTHDPRSDEINKDIKSVLKEIVRRFQHETLKHTKWFLLRKPVALWSWDIVNGWGDVFPYEVSKSPYKNRSLFQWTHMLMHSVHWPLVVLGMLGCLLVWFPRSMLGLSEESAFAARFASLLLIYYTLLHMVGAPFPRYSVPLRPFLYGMALLTPPLVITAISKYRKTREPGEQKASINSMPIPGGRIDSNIQGLAKASAKH